MSSRNMFINFDICIKDSKLEKKCTKNGIQLQKVFSMSDMSASSTNIPWPKSRLDSRYDCALCRLAGGSSGSATVPSEHTCLGGLLLLATAMYCINRSTLLYKTVVFRLRCCLHACKAGYAACKTVGRGG
jgi:hypothetical protein